MLHCNSGGAGLFALYNVLKVTMMSKQLKLSAALSFVLMTGFAIVSQLATIAPQPLIGG